MFNGCIATSILTSNRRKRALTANTPTGCTENNSHLFAPESPVRDNVNEDQDEPSPIIEEVSTKRLIMKITHLKNLLMKNLQF